MKDKEKQKIEKDYVSLGITIFVSGAALIVLYMSMNRYNSLVGMLGKGLGIISPFLYGIILAYLLCPVFDFFTKNIYGLIRGRIKIGKWQDPPLALAKAVSTILTLVLFIGFVTGFGFLIFPQIIESLTSLVELIPGRAQEVIALIQSAGQGNSSPAVNSAVEWLQNSTDSIISWINDSLIPRFGNYMSQIYEGVWGTVKTLMNILIGIITSVYLMNERVHFQAGIRKAVRAVFSSEKADSVLGFITFSNKAFGGFISGKIIDSIIVGFICFGAMSVLGLPYAVLVSVIIGITNVIPFFGPFIGAVPGALIIAAADPMKMLVFLVMIFLLQQFDGYVLGPKILGDSTGLSSFWVMFSIIIGGGLFGFIGMVFAVPAFAVIYYYFRKHIENKLADKGMPRDTRFYEAENPYGRKQKDSSTEMAGGETPETGSMNNGKDRGNEQN